ncbi:glycogen/starch/alpha-glucan family phosphorylase [Agathobacter rectalis]|uniref:Alpha-1,4 glucan phosphorylase n=1 Tax=Agathobacter rectalis TaxID=39491 RepID=A0A414IXE2_9FIRM|nr:glycogen/starch/alpha-glucan phosphorylase [Agathobacter rectalis]RGT14495.1 glycogen/starch/alpha-glucan family phosphorylase [Agathobacter rectalis]RGT20008.1 glycogen/starch/alpha-glucan family phosphorylase [Agathobacter rectalis]RHE34180.1 glycogen/starch/alpha-glucan family phosphorylase [Agathobacter rectalis]
MAIMQEIETKLQKGISVSTDEEVYYALLELIKDKAEKKVSNKGKKKLYYISAEFLIGKLLSNNLINLGIYDEVKETLEKNGKSLAEIEEIELEPSLGNGGLGRLAACFIDSIATLGLNGDGVGLNYHYGLFKQVFENNLQKETPNPWITKESWLTKTDITYPVSFGGFTVQSRLYDIDVVGYNNRTTKLHLFDIESVDESIVGDTIDFDKDDIRKNLTLFLYPDDSDDKGRLLRVYQQYFMVSNAARLILAEAEAKGSNLHDLADYAAVQINDTHPSMVIPELIRLLQEKGILMDEAIEIVSKVCAYTNHTILAEALEKWPISFLEKAVPQLMPIIRELDNKVRAKVADESTYIIKDGLVHMAHMDIHFGYSVNGVAYLHTEILKNTELNNFYKLYPEKFNNKTNGITFRRWLMSCNPELSAYITELIGDGWKKDANELEKLGNFINDDAVLTKLVDIKNAKKTELASYLKKTQNLDVPDNSIFDIQVKRLHEYKRQQLNVLYIIRKYFEIKAGKKPSTPITCFFGAKAAPAYIIAKDIIHAILCLQQIINNDPEVSPYLKVFMVENYNVTLAEKLFPAANISEQISLASKEASGTGNMKFMLNGAITLGTSDGANVEIAELVGDENIYVFGEDSQTVIDRYERGDYCSKDYYDKDADLKKAVDFLVSDEMMKVGSKENLERLYNELLNKDWFMTFPDFEDYCKTKEKAYADYEDKKAWAKKMLVNISKAGFFSSDRTIKQYNDEIWHLEA